MTEHDEMSTAYDPSTAMRWLLGALSLGAAAVHLVMVPQHAQESLGMGLAFAAAGWFQVAFGVAMFARPTRRWVQLGISANVLFIATWALSRTVGLPDWTGDGGASEVSSTDVVCVVLEAALVLGAVALLIAPNLLREWKQPRLTVAGVVPAAILAATTAVLASPSTADHAHSDDSTAGEHDHSAPAAELAGGHDHTSSALTYEQLPEVTRGEVDQVIARWATRYPTGADAAKDGWYKATPSLYGIGAHYIRGNAFGGAATFDMLNPNILLFDGEGPDAKFAGVSYVVAEKPEGFTGDDDSWHSHRSVCMEGLGQLSLTEEDSPVWYSESECTASGGRVMPLDNDQMMHLWIGPDYIDDAPVFAHDHPDLYGGYRPKNPT